MDFNLTEIKDINAASVKRDNSLTMAIMHTKVISKYNFVYQIRFRDKKYCKIIENFTYKINEKNCVNCSKNIHQPVISKGKTYEVDEMCTYIRHKRNFIWLVYALEKNSKNVVSFNVGKRTNKTLSRVLDTFKLSEAKKIFTDGLKNYRNLIDEKLHSVKRFGTNHIERKNLTLRTHIKRLNRRTICYSKSLVVLIAILKIYFWF